jgi:3-oxoacyl-(acyl-carrier-protein) synthase
LESRAHVAGLGIISAIGDSVTQTLSSFKNHQSGIGALQLFESALQHLPVGEVKYSNQQLTEVLGLKERFNRTTLLGIYAARQACKDFKHALAWRRGVICGTTVGGMDRTENFFKDYVKKDTAIDFYNLHDHECGSITERIAEDVGFKDSIATINTACSSSVNSIIYASRLIRAGLLDVAIAGGVDALTRFTLNGFNSLMILDKEPCRPFDANRNGLNLGEGAGFLLLVSDKVLKQESLQSFCEVTGYGNTNDAFHQTASSPDGRGSFLAMEAALKMANLTPSDIDYINLHGTGTKNNDASEGTAIKRLFGDSIPSISSTKSFTGHTLGASGGIEAVFSVIAINNGCLFPNLRFASPMPEVELMPQTEFKSAVKINHVMSNSFGFGGNCSSIIFSAK